jgi:hypothetical protein
MTLAFIGRGPQRIAAEATGDESVRDQSRAVCLNGSDCWLAPETQNSKLKTQNSKLSATPSPLDLFTSSLPNSPRVASVSERPPGWKSFQEAGNLPHR